MKKLLLLSLIAAGALTASARDFTVTVQGNPVEPGQTIDAYCLEVYEQPVGNQVMRSYKLDPHVMLNATKVMPMMISVTNTTTNINEEYRQKYMEENFGDDPYEIAFCWPSQCIYGGPGETKTQTGDTKLVPDNLRIDSRTFEMNAPLEGLTLSCTITILPTDNPSDIFEFNLNMINGDAAVDGIIADEETPVYYNLNGVKVANPDHGIFIVKKGAKTSKVIL